MNLLEGMRNDCTEGNISWFPERQKTLVDIIATLKPKNLIEIGFNMGHSALIICDTIVSLKNSGEYGDEPVTFHIFDLCEHECTVPNFEILAEEAKKHNIFMNLIPGSSLETLPRFMEYNSEQTFDFIEIDGCHTYDCLKSDLEHTIGRVKPEGFLIIDDYKSTKAPIPDIDKLVDETDWGNFESWYIDGIFWAKRKPLNIYTLEDILRPYEVVNHPLHYGGEDNPYEAIKVIEAWGLGFNLGNTIKYISRAGKKGKEIEDLKKALWYLNHHVTQLENQP